MSNDRGILTRMEIINAKIAYMVDYEIIGSIGQIAYALGTHIEELCEMIGTSTFIYALLIYLQRIMDGGVMQIGFHNDHKV